MRRAIVLVVVAAVALVAGCSSDADDAAPSTTTTSTTAGSVASIRFDGPFDEVRLDGGIVVHDCEGERPSACVDVDGAPAGDLELIAGYPAAAGDTPRGWARDMVDTFRRDRAEGCPGFTFEAHPIRDAVVGGRPGASGGFRLLDAGGAVVEDVRDHFVRLGDGMAVVATDAYARTGGCLPPPDVDPSFTPAQLARLLPHLDDLVAHAALPAAAEPGAAADCTNRPAGDSPARFDAAAGTYAASSLAYDRAERTLRFDVVQWISAPDLENDYRIDNESPEIRSAPVAADADILGIAENTATELVHLAPADLASHLARTTQDVWWLTFRSGTITALCQQYRP